MRSLGVGAVLAVACISQLYAESPPPQPAKQAALVELSTCDAWLNKGDNGAGWRRFLHFDSLRQEMEKGVTADRSLLDEVIAKLESGVSGTDLPQFTSLHEALLDLRAELDIERSRQESVVVKAPAPIAEGAVGSVAALSTTPNFYARVSGKFLSSGLDRCVNECSPLTDCILGTSICGTTLTNAQVHFALVPNCYRAQFDLVFTGTAYSNTVGSNRSALIYTTGTTQLVGHKPILAEFGGLYEGGCATAWASTCTNINCTGSTKPGLRGQIVSKVAAKKAGKSKAEAESIAADHAENRLRTRLDETIPAQLMQSNQRYQETLIQPLTQRGLLPHDVLLGTTSQHLYISGVESTAGQPGGSGAPMPLIAADLGGQIHEGLLGNILTPRVAGKKLDDEGFRKLVIDLLGRLPDEFPAANKDESFEVQFPETDPITTKFDNDSIFIIIRGKSFEADKDRKISDAQITVEYKIVKTPSGIRFLLQEEPGNPAKEGADHKNYFAVQFEKSTLRSTADKAILRKKLLKVFHEEINPDLAIKGNWERYGKLPTTEATTRAGWLTLGWTIPTIISSIPTPAPSVPAPVPTAPAPAPIPEGAMPAVQYEPQHSVLADSN